MLRPPRRSSEPRTALPCPALLCSALLYRTVMMPASIDGAVPGYSIAAMRLPWDSLPHPPVADTLPMPCPVLQLRSRLPYCPAVGPTVPARALPPPGAARGASLRPPDLRPCSPARPFPRAPVLAPAARPKGLPPFALPTRGGRPRRAVSLRDPAAVHPTGGGERGRTGGGWPGAGRGDGGRHGGAAGRRNAICAAAGAGPGGPPRARRYPRGGSCTEATAGCRLCRCPRDPSRRAAFIVPQSLNARRRCLSREGRCHPGRAGAGPSGGRRQRGVTALQHAALCLGTARAAGKQRHGPARGYAPLCSHVELCRFGLRFGN